MQLKTTLSVKEFRDRFSHKTSPEWAIGSQVTPEGRFPSGRLEKGGFVLRISKAAVHPLTPEAKGTVTAEDGGCTLSWKVRRRAAGMVLLLVMAAIAAVVAYCFGPVSVMALIVSVEQDPSMWGSALILSGISLAMLALGVWSVLLCFWVPRKTQARLEAHLRRVVGDEHIAE